MESDFHESGSGSMLLRQFAQWYFLLSMGRGLQHRLEVFLSFK